MHYIITLSLLIAALLLIRGIFRNKLNPVVMYALWLVLVIKLCVPISLFEVDFSAFRKSDAPSEGLYEIIDDTYFYESEAVNVSEFSPVTESISQDKNNISTEKEPIKNEDKGNIKAPAASVGQVKAPAAKIEIKSLLKIIWTVGAELIALWFISTSLIFAFGVHRDRKLIGKYKGIKVYVSEKARTPCVFGLIPSIYLTVAANESDERELILLHEYTHLRHGDNLWAIVRTAVLIFHWWNPLVWAAALLSKQDGEIACDNAVTRSLDEARKKKYAYMLIDMIPKKPTLATGFANNSIKERIIMMTNSMTKKRKSNALITIFAVLLMIFAASCSFIGEEQAGESKELFPTYENVSGYEILSIDYYKFDGENMYTATIEDRTAIDNLLKELNSVKAVMSKGFNRGEKTIYGIKLNWSDYANSRFDVYGFIDDCLITADGTSYKFEYDLTKIEKAYLKTDLVSTELAPEFPCLWHIALDGDKWNEYYLPTSAGNGASSTLTSGFEIKPLRFFGESFEFECVDAYGHVNNTIFTGTYAFRVLLGTKWYILPYTPTFKPEIYTLKSYPMQDGVGQGLTERQMILTREIGEFKIPIETPTGYYRLSCGGLSHDIVINKDVRANIIDISDIGGIERIDAQIREIIPALYYGEPFEGGFVYCDYTLLGLEKDDELLRATVAICHRNYSNSGDPTDFIGKTYPAIINFKEERGKYIIESTISPETAWTDVTKYFGEGIITNINSALDAMTNKAFAEAIEYYNIDADANIKAIIDETFEFVSMSEESNPYENYNFSRNGGKLRYYGEFALEYFFEEYVKGESEGVYDEVLKALLPYVTGFNDKSAKSFSDLFERTYNLAEYEKNKTIIKYSPVLSSFLEIVPSEKYRERFYINNPSFARLESKNILDTSELELLFTYNYEKKNTEYFFYVTKTEPKRFKVGYKDEDGDIITNTANIPSQFLYESSEPLLMDYRDRELFYVVKLMREDDDPIYLKFIIESNKFYPSPRPVPNFEQITEREAEALLSEQKG